MIIETFIFIIGLIFGSFGNNIVSHFINKSRLDLGRSSCMCGEKKLTLYELFPLISFIFLRGKCTQCKKKIPLRYFWVEIISAMLAIICLWKFDLTLIFAINYFSIYIMFLIAVIDLYSMFIPNSLLFSLFIISIINLFLFQSQIMISIGMAIGLVAIFISVNFFFSQYHSKEAIGAGDIKYIAILTLLFAFPISLLGLWFSALFAIPGFYLIKLIFNEYNNEKRIPFGLFLSFGYLIASFTYTWFITTYNNIIMSN